MKFSENWLRTFVNPGLSTERLADVLTFGGLEVEAIEPAAPGFDQVVVGEVLQVVKHPDADRLTVCEVDSGKSRLSVVCGAPNVRAGIKVPLALPGATLPGGLLIKTTKVRGAESQGMLCSEKELGLSDDASGLMLLPASAQAGQNIREVLDLDDALFTTKPTPNRGDCLSILGVAREVSALTGAQLSRPATTPVVQASTDTLSVTLHAPDACPRYCGRLIQGVNVTAATPLWMVQRLARSDVRSISAIVDITNYVMLEMGQPLHAFDAAKLDGGIEVRFAREGESIMLLNGEQPVLAPDMLVISDAHEAVALAGIMGGADSAVTAVTQDIFLESAFFAPEIIAGKSRVLGFGSESSYRFERGVDFAATRLALERATRLIVDICGGRPGPVTEASSILPQREAVPLRMTRVERLLGVELGDAQLQGIFRRLDFPFRVSGDRLLVTPPSYRFDIVIEEDLVEEIARIHGYENIPAATPIAAAPMLPAREEQKSASDLRHFMAIRDYNEVVTYSFVDTQWEEDFCDNRRAVALANPIASQMAVMRSSLIGGLVDCVAFNVRHKQQRIRVFEIGRCFMEQQDHYSQPMRLGAAAYGTALKEHWMGETRAVDFYDIKGDIEALFAPRQLRFEPAGHAALHPGKSARILCDGEEAGWLGELHPRWQRKYDLPLAPVLLEVDLASVTRSAVPQYNEIPKFPPVRRDLAAIFDEEIEYQDILDAMREQRSAVVAGITLFDVYRGSDLGSGRKSLAFRVLLQDTRKTLTDAEVESAVAQLREVLQRQFNAKLR